MADAMLRLEKANAENAVDLHHLWARTFEEAYADVHSPSNIREYCEANYSLEKAEETLADPQTDCVLASNDGEFAGFLVLLHRNCPVRTLSGGASELKQIYDLKSQYGAGLGNRLYQEALRLIRARDRQWIWLVVSDRNVRAQAFYKKAKLETVALGPVLEVGTDRLNSTILAGRI